VFVELLEATVDVAFGVSVVSCFVSSCCVVTWTLEEADVLEADVLGALDEADVLGALDEADVLGALDEADVLGAEDAEVLGAEEGALDGMVASAARTLISKQL